MIRDHKRVEQGTPEEMDKAMPIYKRHWSYQEWWVNWTLFGLGWKTQSGRGWSPDELSIFVGPIQIIFLKG